MNYYIEEIRKKLCDEINLEILEQPIRQSQQIIST